MTEYKNEHFSQDWVLLYTTQMGNNVFDNAYWAHRIDFIVWTTDRQDGNTLVWVQTKGRRARSTLERWFPGNAWVGTTHGKEEYDDWFQANPRDRFNWRGTYKIRHPSGVISGRSTMVEILEATDAMAQDMDAQRVDLDTDEDEPGELVRTEARYF